MTARIILALAILASGASPVAASGAIGTPAIGGVATFYAAPTAHDAAAGPLLRELLGPKWRGQWVTVTAGSHSVTVRVTDWCACGMRHGKETLIDLDSRSFAFLAPLSQGVVEVRIEPAAALLPPTDAVAVAEDPNVVLVWLALFIVASTWAFRAWGSRLSRP